MEAKHRVRKRILLIDDDPETLKMIQTILEWDGYFVECLDHLPEHKDNLISEFDLILLDVHLGPQQSGLEWLKLFKKQIHPEFIPIVIISGDAETETIVKGLDSGADDYIIKPFSPPELLARVRAQLRIGELTAKLKKANAQLQELVEIDDLTGLYNMRSIYQKINLEIERARRYNRNVCVVMMDMDYFKTVNDGHDHLFGSYILAQVGRIIRSSIRNIDLAARYGGDEFLILLTETHAEGALAFCERLRQTIAQTHFKSGPDEIDLTASLGFAVVNPSVHPIDAQALVRHADHALYEAKRSGRNKVCSRLLLDPPQSNNKKAS